MFRLLVTLFFVVPTLFGSDKLTLSSLVSASPPVAIISMQPSKDTRYRELIENNIRSNSEFDTKIAEQERKEAFDSCMQAIQKGRDCSQQPQTVVKPTQPSAQVTSLDLQPAQLAAMVEQRVQSTEGHADEHGEPLFFDFEEDE